MAALLLATDGGSNYTTDMISKITAAFMLLACTNASLAQSTKEPLVLTPSSSWQVDYDTDRCRLGREFGADKNKVLLIMDRYGPGEYFRLTLAGEPFVTKIERAEIALQFGPAETEQRHLFMKGSQGTMPALVFAGSLRIAGPTPAEELARKKIKSEELWEPLAKISDDRYKLARQLLVGKPLRRSVMLKTGPIRAPFAALDKCIDELMTHWSIDVEKHKSLSREVKPTENPGRWIVSKDYPRDMLNAGQPAMVEFRLNVGVDSKPTACHIQSTTRPKEFDDAVCKSVMRRATFEPALDADGKPLASYYQNTVRFQTP